MEKWKISLFLAAGILIIPLGWSFTQPAPQGMRVAVPVFANHGPMMGPRGMMMGNWQWMRVRMQAIHSMPSEYRGLRNPLKPTEENILAGGRLYQQFCSSCHGATGRGDGPAAQGLNPPPAPLAFTIPMHMTTDGYLFWRIKEGGQTFGTAMPPWGASLKEDQIWQIVLYMRAGFPPIGEEEENREE